jgi:hypothetical protein
VKKATLHRCTRAVSFDLNSRSPLCQFLVFDKTPSSPDGRFV